MREFVVSINDDAPVTLTEAELLMTLTKKQMTQLLQKRYVFWQEKGEEHKVILLSVTKQKPPVVRYVLRFQSAAGIHYLVKDGEVKTIIVKGREQVTKGVKVTAYLKEATHFESLQEATKYHKLVGVNGKRGHLMKIIEESE